MMKSLTASVSHPECESLSSVSTLYAFPAHCSHSSCLSYQTNCHGCEVLVFKQPLSQLRMATKGLEAWFKQYRGLILQAQSPEFKSQSHQKKKKEWP
jgi:hypothetical protein